MGGSQMKYDDGIVATHYLDEMQERRDRCRQQLALRAAGKAEILPPDGFTTQRWIEILEGEVTRYTSILKQAGRS
jgi:hypothetical protein